MPKRHALNNQAGLAKIGDVTERSPRHPYIQERLDLDEPVTPTPKRRRIAENPSRRRQKALHEVVGRYIDLGQLRRLATTAPDQLHSAVHHPAPPAEVHDLLRVLTAMLTPPEGYQIKSPADVAALFMVEMCNFDQEHLRTVLLDNKNRVQDIVTVYVGSVNTAMVRIGELYKDAVRRNSTAIILAHNHPSGDPTPSPEDILVTRQVVEAGNLLDIQCLDHLVIGKGKYVSMRERGLGFPA